MGYLSIIFILVVNINGYLESIDLTKFSSAESCFDQKLLSPTRNCATETLNVLNGLKSAFSDIQSTYKTVPRIKVRGLSTGLLNVFASSDQNVSGLGPEKALMESSGAWCSDLTIASTLFYQMGSSLPVTFNSLELKSTTSLSITSFKIVYTSDGINWSNYNSGQVFAVNSAFSKYNFTPFIARAIRIYIQDPKPNTCAKFEVLITPLDNHKVLSSGALIAALNSGFKVRTSSVESSSYHVKSGYLEYNINGQNSWCSSGTMENKNQWLSVSSAVKMRWKRIYLKAQSTTVFISSFRIAYSDNGYKWNWYLNGSVISGMSSTKSEVILDLTSFDALVVRIYAESWTTGICTRIEAYCSEI